jgi:hypothetical protein
MSNKSLKEVLEKLVWEAMKEGQQKNYLQPKDREFGVSHTLAQIEGMVPEQLSIDSKSLFQKGYNKCRSEILANFKKEG